MDPFIERELNVSALRAAGMKDRCVWNVTTCYDGVMA